MPMAANVAVVSSSTGIDISRPPIGRPPPITPMPKNRSPTNSITASRNGNRNMPPSSCERDAGDARSRSIVPWRLLGGQGAAEALQADAGERRDGQADDHEAEVAAAVALELRRVDDEAADEVEPGGERRRAQHHQQEAEVVRALDGPVAPEHGAGHQRSSIARLEGVGLQQRLQVHGGRGAVRLELLDGADERQAAADHDGDVVGDALELLEPVRRQQHGAAAVGQAAQVVDHLAGRERIEAARRLVEDDHVRVVHQGAGDGEPGPHAGRVAEHPPVAVRPGRPPSAARRRGRRPPRAGGRTGRRGTRGSRRPVIRQ